MHNRDINVYLAGEIHSDWREKIISSAGEKGIMVNFTSPVTNHEKSDLCGVRILGEEASDFWKDRKSSEINNIRKSIMIRDADIVVVCFGPKYKQWNAAFDAGYASALNKSIITIHDEEHDHALKEVDASARATARTPEQVVQILEYITS